LRQLWLELTDRCNLRCVHCYADASPTASRPALEIEHWERVLDQAASLGAWWVQLIGGEPLLAGKERLFAVIARARALRFRVIEVFTNATLLDDACAGFFRENGVNVAVSVYASRPEVHDGITRSAGSFQRTMAAIERLKTRGVPVRVGIVVMAQNASYEAETAAAHARALVAPSPDATRVPAGLPGELRPQRVRPPLPQRQALRPGRRTGVPVRDGQVQAAGKRARVIA
jgi:MoaA/NifB/PqqE/SkfB family radical SAM enzyme